MKSESKPSTAWMLDMRRRNFGPGSTTALTGSGTVARFADGTYAETDAEAALCTRVIYTHRRGLLPLPQRLRGEWECVVFAKDQNAMNFASPLLMLARNPRIDFLSEETVPVSPA